MSLAVLPKGPPGSQIARKDAVKVDFLRENAALYPTSILFWLWFYRVNYTDRPHENHTANILKQLDKVILFLYEPYFLGSLPTVIPHRAAIVFL
jgi:hypothetical protein